MVWTQVRLCVCLSKAPLGVILNLATVGFPGCDDAGALSPLCVDDDEEPPLRVAVETKAIFAVVPAVVWLMDCVWVEEGLDCEAEVEATFLKDLVAFALIPFKLQFLQGFLRYFDACKGLTPFRKFTVVRLG